MPRRRSSRTRTPAAAVSTEQFQQSAALLGLLPVRGVTRAVPLKQNISVSAVIGQDGGTISIPDAGLTLVVPPGAVTSSTKFTATALAGRLVAYEFEPHGTKFAVPLRFTQDLKKLSLLGVVTAPVLDGAYFTDASRLNQTARHSSRQRDPASHGRPPPTAGWLPNQPLFGVPRIVALKRHPGGVFRD